MDVKACDNCKKLNTEVTKPFARVHKTRYRDMNTGLSDNNSISCVSIYPDFNSDKGPEHHNTKVLCSDCTMSFATDLVKQMFSTENLAKLSQHP